MLSARNEGGKAPRPSTVSAGTFALARFMRAALVPLTLALPPLFWIVDATRRASLSALGRDQGVFQYIAWALSKGAVDYRDVRDVNGPLTHWVHVVFLAVGGGDEHTLRVVDLLVTGSTFAFAGACLPGLGCARRPSSGFDHAPAKPGTCRPSVLERGAWAVAAWVVLSGQYLLYGFWDLAQRESFFDWFMLPSVALQLVAQTPRRGPKARRVTALLFVAVGALSVTPWFGKPTYALFTLGQLAVIATDAKLTLARKQSLLAFAGGAVLATAVQLGLLLLRGDVSAYFRIQVFDVPAMYRFIWPRSVADLMSLPRIATPAAMGLVGATVLFSLVVLGEAPQRIAAVALVPVCALGSVIVQAKGFPYHMHPVTAGVYLQALALLAWLTERMRVAARRRALMRLLPIAASASLALHVAFAMQASPHVRADWLLWSWSDKLRATREYIDHFATPDFFPDEMRQAAAYLAKHTREGDRVQTYGMDPYVLFLAKRLSATPYIYAYDLDADAAIAGGTAGRPTHAQAAVIASMRAAHEADLLARIRERPPAAFVFFDEAPTLSQADAWDDFEAHCVDAAPWVRAHYRETSRFGHDRVWLRLDLAASLPE
jgi:hypothetical protein